MSITIDVTSFGVSSSNTPSQNDVGLVAMRQSMLSIQDLNPNVSFIVVFPSAEDPYLYENNRFLWGVLRITLSAYGAKLGHTGSGKFPFNFGNLWSENAPEAPGDTNVDGVLLDDIAAGDVLVIATTASDADTFVPGNRLFLYGFNQQGVGFPPNVRFFEWHDVVDADAVTGQITLSRPVNYRYSNEWTQLPSSVGAQLLSGPPRAKNIDPASGDWRYTEYFHLMGAEIVDFDPNVAGDVALFANVRKFIVTDVVCFQVFVVGNELFQSIRSEFKGPVEIDKVVDSCVFDACHFRKSVRLGSGVNNVSLVNGCIVECDEVGSVDLTARNVLIDGCTIIGNSPGQRQLVGASGFGVDNFNLTNNRIVNRSQTLEGTYSPGNPKNVIIDAVGANKEILIPLAINFSLAATAQFGHWMWNIDTGKGGKVFDVIQYDEDNQAICGDWVVTPQLGETWRRNMVDAARIEGNSLIGVRGEGQRALQQPFLATPGSTKTLKLESHELEIPVPTKSVVLDLYGSIQRLVVIVHSASEGVASPKIKWVFNGVGGVKTIEIDLSIPGRRDLDLSAPQGLDVLDQTLLGRWNTTSFLTVQGQPSSWAVSIEMDASGATH